MNLIKERSPLPFIKHDFAAFQTERTMNWPSNLVNCILQRIYIPEGKSYVILRPGDTLVEQPNYMDAHDMKPIW